MGDFMSIQELLQAAKDIEVTSEQIARLRNLLEEQGKQENLKSSTVLMNYFQELIAFN